MRFFTWKDNITSESNLIEAWIVSPSWEKCQRPGCETLNAYCFEFIKIRKDRIDNCNVISFYCDGCIHSIMRVPFFFDDLEFKELFYGLKMKAYLEE